MREIKFRAWSESLGLLSKPFTLPHLLLNFTNEKGVGVMKSLTDEVVIQYTGLKDKTGVEIYDGDIVAITVEKEFKQVWSVEFEGGGFQVFNQLNSNRRIEESMTEHFLNNDGVLTPIAEFSISRGETVLCEVIGNIHQSPELLQRSA